MNCALAGVGPFLAICLLWLICAPLVCAQSPYYPADGDTLGYNDLFFSWKADKTCDLFEVWVQDANGKDLVKERLRGHKLRVYGLPWEEELQWRVTGIGPRGELICPSEWMRFRISGLPWTDTEQYRIRILKNDSLRAGRELLLPDYCRQLIDRKGNPVWTLPDITGVVERGDVIRDLKQSPVGTFTFLSPAGAFEIDLDGSVLWQAPDDGRVSGDTTEYYHHEFSRLENGNYFVLGNSYRMLPSPKGDSVKVEFGTLIEYRPDSSIAWSWSSERYFSPKALFTPVARGRYDTRTHLNAAYFDAEGKYLYAGFRDISRIIKIEKATGKVVASYGQRRAMGEARFGNGFFRRQHGGMPLDRGRILVFNNDSVMDPAVSSSVVIFTEATAIGTGCIKIWEFDCKFDTLSDGKSVKTGNALILPNENILVNMGQLNRVVEVTMQKEVVWDAFLEKWDSLSKSWAPFPSYRVSTVKDLYPYAFELEDPRYGETLPFPGTDSLEIIVHNHGSRADTYDLYVYPPGGSYRQHLRVPEVPPGGSLRYRFKPLKRLKLFDQVTLELHSGQAPHLTEISIHEISH